MSADNGIYILETQGPEYRVAEMGNIEDIDWNEETKLYDASEDQRIENAREMSWKFSRVFNNPEDAMSKAIEIISGLLICEYGICTIAIDRKF